jgi:DMSO/TMAO reductase YedYZ molybdopterin-dependent catalytic subunit
MKMKKEKIRRKVCCWCLVGIVACLVITLPVDPPFLRMHSSIATAIAQQGGNACNPSPIAIPVLPKVIPGYTEVDKETGLHVTGTPPANLDFKQYRLEVSGKVNRPLQLTYDEVRCLPKVTARPRLICPGFFVDEANWSGAPLKQILEKAGVKASARAVRLTAADQYFVVLSLKQAMAESAFIAYEWEGKPLPILHGFPVRAVLPGLEGNQWVKWLIKIEVE